MAPANVPAKGPSETGPEQQANPRARHEKHDRRHQPARTNGGAADVVSLDVMGERQSQWRRSGLVKAVHYRTCWA